jgi:Concanavalin A-like lectin/glucanases superfamily/Secretion system C-terminal sorting domain
MQKHLLTVVAVLCLTQLNFAQAPTAGLVAYWPMNGNLTDIGPSAINTTVVGAITATTNNGGNPTGAMAFTNNPAVGAATQYGIVPVTAAINFAPGSSFTISFNFKLTTLPASGGFGFFDNNINYGGYGIYGTVAPTTIRFQSRNNVVSATGISLNTWYNVTGVRTGTSISIYINGNFVAIGNDGVVASPPYSFTGRIGTMFFNGYAPPVYNGLTGAIDELRIYNRVLSAAEVAALSASALPVGLTQFTATKNSNGVLLNWQTEFEQNSSHFNIQRSIDGTNFTNIGTAQAKGNTAASTAYLFADNTVKATGAKTIFYRLQQVDLDGKSYASNILSVKLETTFDLLTLLQNPATNDLRIQMNLQKAQPVQFLISNIEGKTVLTSNNLMPVGQTAIALPISKLLPGSYVVTSITGNTKESKFFIKQ